jgi:hypothetical protein
MAEPLHWKVLVVLIDICYELLHQEIMEALCGSLGPDGQTL